MDPDRQLAHLTKTLNLSADQQTQIKPILLDRQQKMQVLWQDQSLSRQDRRSKAIAIQQDTKRSWRRLSTISRSSSSTRCRRRCRPAASTGWVATIRRLQQRSAT